MFMFYIKCISYYTLLYNEYIYLLLYKRVYNNNKHFIYQEMFVVIIYHVIY